MAADFTSPQSSPGSFWQLISGVAHDLDLMLQDLFPDAIPSALREEYGLADHVALDHHSFANHAALLEQFMRRAPDTTIYGLGPAPSTGEYRSSKSLQQLSETTSDSLDDGRTSPGTNSSQSPPPPAPPPREYASGAQAGLVNSSSVSSIQDISDGDSSHTSSSIAPCDIGLLERLIRTHPVWFLPNIGRAGATHLLQGKDVGNFVVRQSSKPGTMALSVRLPEGKSQYVEHYLIETVGDAKLRLEGSDNNFHAIPMLVAHYAQCCDELPVQLSLPASLSQASSRQELSSLSLLGQDFWLSALVKSPSYPLPPGTPNPVNPQLETSQSQHSTFKPAPSLPKTRTGPSPPSTLLISKKERQQQDVSTSSSSPPPPVAPKHQFHGAPPPPPPRSFIPGKIQNPAKDQTSPPTDTSPEISSPTSSNNDCKSSPSNDLDTDDAKEDQKPLNVFKDKEWSTSTPSEPIKVIDLDTGQRPRTPPTSTHYMQSNLADLEYYRSSLSDKISDYEDIWAKEAKEANGEGKLKSFQTPVKSNFEKRHPRAELFFRRQHSENVLSTNVRYMLTQGTQTEQPFAFQASAIDSQTASNKFSPKGNDLGHFSSPFYNEELDSHPVAPDSIYNGTTSDYLTHRFFNHRFSDPNLHWPQNSKKVGSAVDEERLSSLSSSVDNLKILSPSVPHRRQQNISLSTQWVEELNQRISAAKKDSQTQVSLHDLHAEKSSSPKKPKKNRQRSQAAWNLDSSWEWMGHDDDSSTSSDDREVLSGSKFSLHRNFKETNHLSDLTTVEDLIAMRTPELSLPNFGHLAHSTLMRISEYDNLDRQSPPEPATEPSHDRTSESIDDTATEFCEPWDSLRWERLLRLVLPETDILADDESSHRGRRKSSGVEMRNNIEIGDTVNSSIGFDDTESNSTASAFSDVGSEGDTSASDFQSLNSDRYRNKSFEERLEPLLAAQRVTALRNRSMSKIGENIRHYIFRLAEERDNTFAKSIEHFIQCTKDSMETKPGIVMRNIRQFMSGIKNYLLKHGEGRFENLLQEERGKLKPDEFLDIDAVIEDSLHKLVIKPLKAYIYQLFVNEYTRNGSLKLLSDNIKFARTKSPEELGVRPEFKLPEGTALEVVNHFLNKLQQAYSPLKKLENLLQAISAIYNSVQQDKIAQGKEHISLGAGDFLPIFICVLVRCGLIAAEIEADYMWGLLHPSLMAREGGYYLTTLSSAVHVLKSLQACSPDLTRTQVETFDNMASCSGYGTDASSPRSQITCKTPSPEPRLACIADLQGFLKIMIPDELTGSIISKTLPIKPNMTTKEVVKLIAHKFNITNPQDYCLFKLVNGEEAMLGDGECPQVIKADLLATGCNCLFTYKRCDAKFIWPIMENKSS